MVMNRGTSATEIDSIEPPQRYHPFNYLASSESAAEKMVSRIFGSWNQLGGWLRGVDALRRVAWPTAPRSRTEIPHLV
jgi:hypothetical protein